MCILYCFDSSLRKNPRRPGKPWRGRPSTTRATCSGVELLERDVGRQAEAGGGLDHLLGVADVGGRGPGDDGPFGERLRRVGDDPRQVDRRRRGRTPRTRGRRRAGCCSGRGAGRGRGRRGRNSGSGGLDRRSASRPPRRSRGTGRGPWRTPSRSSRRRRPGASEPRVRRSTTTSTTPSDGRRESAASSRTTSPSIRTRANPSVRNDSYNPATSVSGPTSTGKAMR